MTHRWIYKLIFCFIKTHHSVRMTSRGAAECNMATICSLHPRIDPITMPPKAKTPWQHAHGLEYALEVVSTAGNGDITV
jgi:hypothetical protein